ncbi:MAG TPA: biotin--[acetyl-CoA-carboxylase] ligase [Trebonia sp.]|nr:biotin--[acetyl-CoA-carboxylase] ligase [Trebonia sp.]
MSELSLDGVALRAAAGGGLWTSVTVVPSTGSTNADLLVAGGPEGQVLVAEEQTAGRGRMGRGWVSEPGAALTFSVLLRPEAALGPRRGWLPLLAGVAVATAVRTVSGLTATLKWPNDVLIGDRKVCGILAEQSADAVVIGTGINVATPAGALPGAPSGPGGLRATSLAVEGAGVPRDVLLVEVLRQIERRYTGFRANPDPAANGLLADYEALCATLGRTVRVELPAGRTLTGEAAGIDADGRLLVTAAGRTTAVSAGDVIHVR